MFRMTWETHKADLDVLAKLRSWHRRLDYRDYSAGPSLSLSWSVSQSQLVRLSVSAGMSLSLSWPVSQSQLARLSVSVGPSLSLS